MLNETSMGPGYEPNVSVSRRSSPDWAKLICKLRWIGLEDEARSLERAVSTLHPQERGSVSVGPFDTD
jgi:hypothetical protein